MKKYNVIFFDWDGVITDSVNIKTESYYDMFADFGIDVQNKVKEHHLLNGGMSRFEKFKLYYKEFLGKDISQDKVIELSNEFSDLVMKKVASAPFIEGAVETIKREYENGTKLFVVTGTPTEEIKEIAKQKGLYNYFVDFCGSPKKKIPWVKELIEKYNLKKDDCLFVGDAMVDYNAALENGIDFLGIKIKSCKTKFPDGTIVKEKVEL